MENILLCYKYVNLLNPEKNFKLEKFWIITSTFQINTSEKCNQILIDGNFKSRPKGCYQTINFTGYLDDIQGIVPIFMIPTTRKSQFIYDNIFKEIKKY